MLVLVGDTRSSIDETDVGIIPVVFAVVVLGVVDFGYVRQSV